MKKFQVAAKHKVERQKADAIKLKSEVEKRKRQLLDKQMQQLKVNLQYAFLLCVNVNRSLSSLLSTDM